MSDNVDIDQEKPTPEEIALQAKIDALSVKLAAIQASLQDEFNAISSEYRDMRAKALAPFRASGDYDDYRDPMVDLDKLDPHYSGLGWRTSSLQCQQGE